MSRLKRSAELKKISQEAIIGREYRPITHRDLRDWLVRLYDRENYVIDFWTIKNKSGEEAAKEVKENVSKRNDVEDWTLHEK